MAEPRSQVAGPNRPAGPPGTALKPIVPGAWRDLDPPVRDDLLAELSREGRPFPPATQIRARSLAFLEDHHLLEVIEPTADGGVAMRHVLLGPGRLVPLTGQTTPIHEANAEAFRCAGKAQAADYIRFFTSFTRSPDGRFHIVETPADLWPGERIRPDRLAAFEAKLVSPVAVERAAGGEGWMVRASLVYGTSLFLSRFAVRPTGFCEMLEDDCAVSDVLVAREPWEDGAYLFASETMAPANADGGRT